ncbi:MAG: hypothetical protein Kow0077_26890 [Anaerolineae bacterium]
MIDRFQQLVEQERYRELIRQSEAQAQVKAAREIHAAVPEQPQTRAASQPGPAATSERQVAPRPANLTTT